MSYDSYDRDASPNDEWDRGHDKVGRFLHDIDPLAACSASDMRDVEQSRKSRHRRDDRDMPSDGVYRNGYGAGQDHNAGHYVEERAVRRRRLSEPGVPDHHHYETDRRGMRGDNGRDRPRSQSKQQRTDWAHVASSVAVAGAVEAFRSRHDRENAARAVTAAAAAGVVDGVIGRNHDGKGKRHVAASVIAGLAVDRLAYGRHR